MRAFLALAGAIALSTAAHAGSFTIPAFTLTGGGGSDPTVGLIPSSSDGYANWSMAGTVPVNRTTIYRTISPSGGDDTAAINSALGSCPANQVVLLTTGVFHITGGGLAFTTSNCTLRGSGAGQQLSTGLNKVGGGGTARACSSGTLTTYGNDSFCTDPTATQLVKSDRASDNNMVLNVYAPGSNVWATSYNLAADAVQGSSSLTLTQAPSGLSAGSIVYLDELTVNDPNVVWGPSFSTTNAIGYGMRRTNSSLADLLEVASVNGTTVTFTTPIPYPYRTTYNAQLTTYPVPFLHGTGIENLFIWGGSTNGNINFSGCAYCWVKGVESSWSIDPSISLSAAFKTTIRDSFVHETPQPEPGGAGYMLNISGGSSQNLIENNILWYGNKVDVMRAAGGGNVFAYNYTDDAFGMTYPDSSEAGINAGHLTTPHLELLEGNYSPNFKGDTYWGNSIFITAFRNWLSGNRAARPPLNTYTFNGGNCTASYGDYNGSGRASVQVQAYSFNNNFVGNVLGVSGQSLLHGDGCTAPQGAFVLQETTTAQWNANGSANNIPVWSFGQYQATVNTTGNWSFVDTTINTQTRNGNWDWFTGAQHWYGTGGIVNNGTPVTIPNSFYLAAKPTFFGTQAWPWVDPTTGLTQTLPAKYCFEHGQMPTCLQ